MVPRHVFRVYCPLTFVFLAILHISTWYLLTGSEDPIMSLHTGSGDKRRQAGSPNNSVTTTMATTKASHETTVTSYETKTASDGPFNVLLLGADDMRPEIRAFTGFDPVLNPGIRTPNLDELAAESAVFPNTFCQYPFCNPSRTSMLTGRRISTTHVTINQANFRSMGLNFTTLPQYFKQHGYWTVAAGKVFHSIHERGIAVGDLPSWSEPPYLGQVASHRYWKSKGSPSWYAVTSDERRVQELTDDDITQHSLRKLRELAAGKQPFFFAVGLAKPHAPFIFPEEYLEHYPLDSISLPREYYGYLEQPTENIDISFLPKKYLDLHAIGSDGKDLRGKLLRALRCLRRAYYSSVSYIDSLYGDILSELKRLGLYDRTVVAFWADHGLAIGEKEMFGKRRGRDLTARVPLMVRIPGVTDHGMVRPQLAELVDIYPTLVDAASLPPMPRCPKDSGSIQACREGSSLLPLVRNASTPWKTRVFTHTSYNEVSMRTSRFRYTARPLKPGHDMKPRFRGDVLYDYKIDPTETENFINNPKYTEIIEILQGQMGKGWRGAMDQVEKRT